MMSQVFSSVVLILICFLVYQAVIRSGTSQRDGDHGVRE